MKEIIFSSLVTKLFLSQASLNFLMNLASGVLKGFIVFKLKNSTNLKISSVDLAYLLKRIKKIFIKIF